MLWKSYLRMERAIVPGRENPQNIYRLSVEKHLGIDTIWLDLGCGHKLLPPTLPDSTRLQRGMVERCRFVCGIDGDTASLKRNTILGNRASGDICSLPFRSGSFNLVTANMVVEHIENPPDILREIRRVLVPGGLLIIHTPNRKSYKIRLANAVPDRLKRLIIRHLQNRANEDVYPTHYRMNTLEEQERLARQNGFEVVESSMSQGPADSVMLGPLVLPELLLMKLLSSDRRAGGRSNIVTVLRRS
jgi:SAM-dependent methyltransferase